MTTTTPANPMWQSVLTHPWIKIVALALFVPVLYIAQREGVSPVIMAAITFPLFATAFLALLGKSAYIRTSLGIFFSTCLLIFAAWLYPNPVPAARVSLSVTSFLPSVFVAFCSLAVAIVTAYKLRPDRGDTGARFLYLVLASSMIIIPVAAAFSQLHNIKLLEKLTAPEAIKTPPGEQRNKEITDILAREPSTLLATSVDTITSEIGLIYLVITALIIALAFIEIRKKPSLVLGSGSFPNTSDLPAIVMSACGMLCFYITYSAFTQLKNNLNSFANGIVKQGGTYSVSSSFRSVIGGIEAIPYLILAVGLGILVYRLFKAEKVRFLFTTFLILFLVSIYSIGLSTARFNVNIPIGLLILALLAGLALSYKRGEESIISDPIKLASNATLLSGILLTFLWSGAWAIAIVLASSSVAQYAFLQTWGAQLKTGNPVPLDTWQNIYTTYSADSVSACLFSSLGAIITLVSASAITVLILALLFWIPHLLMVYIRKFLQLMADEEPPAATPAS